MFREFVLSPLWENAEKYEPEGGNEDTSSKELKVMLYDWGWSGKTILTTALGAAAFATIAAYVVFRYRANQIN